jgi:hypothetical protein
MRKFVAKHAAATTGTLSCFARRAPSSDPANIDALALRVVDRQTNAETTSALPSAEDRVARALAEATAPLTVAEIQRACRIRTASICRTLSDLVSEGRIRRTAAGYLLAGR